MSDGPRVILASTSRYRAELLRRLLPAFTQEAPDTDETPMPGEAPAARAVRLAAAKARAVAARHEDAIVIGSDQVASLDGDILRKPGDAATARGQLARSSGRAVEFFTAACLVDTRQPAAEHAALDTTRAAFRELDAGTIERYLDAERPFDCAGSFKCEGLGIALFDRIDSTDPTALVGLPLMAVAGLLRRCGLALP